MIKKLFRFIGRVIKKIVHTVINAVKEIVTNIEAVTILSLATVGTAAVLTELPFHFAVPVIMESTMVIPVISVLLILALVSIMELRLALTH